MATQFLRCNQCHKKSPTHQKLFETLYEFSRTAPDKCPTCGSQRDLHVTLDFQLGAGDTDYRVVSAFLPDKLQSWLGEDDQEVTFYPFLVVLESYEGRQYCWMPYWHLTGKEARFGQHALCMERSQFASLMGQIEVNALESVH